MVKRILNIFKLILFCVILIFVGCNNDFLGFFVSNDLDERLKEKDNLIFLKERDWTNLSLGDSYSFIVLTDTHIENGKTFGLESLVNAITPDIKFAVILGDITQTGAEKDIDKFIEIADSLGIPCFPVIGNHDFYFGNWRFWRDKIGSTSYRINSDTATLFILDSANSFFGKEQLDWLERELKTAKGRIFVFTHSPLFVRGPFGMQQITDTRERARIISILRDKCDIMFMGHSHYRLLNEVGNVDYIVIEDFVSTNVYCLVTVTPDGITYEFKL